MTTVDIIITFLSLIYIYFATQNKVICFIFGLLGSGLWAYHDFVNLNLKFDGVLQLYYVGMSVWGIYNWKFSQKEKEDLPVSRMSAFEHSYTIVFGILLGIAIAWLTRNLFETAYPYLDAVTTAMAIITTIYLVRRKLENWLYWIAIDMVYVYIFIRQDAPLLAGVMGLYALLAVYGYMEWKKIHLNQA